MVSLQSPHQSAYLTTVWTKSASPTPLTVRDRALRGNPFMSNFSVTPNPKGTRLCGGEKEVMLLGLRHDLCPQAQPGALSQAKDTGVLATISIS